MKNITLNLFGAAATIRYLNILKEKLDGYSIRNASGSGSGDVVGDLEQISGNVKVMKESLTMLIGATVVCLQNYVDQMNAADEYAAVSIKGDGQ